MWRVLKFWESFGIEIGDGSSWASVACVVEDAFVTSIDNHQTGNKLGQSFWGDIL